MYGNVSYFGHTVGIYSVANDQRYVIPVPRELKTGQQRVHFRYRRSDRRGEGSKSLLRAALPVEV